MKEIKVFFIHPMINTLKKFLEYIKIENTDLSTRMVWDEINPDYLFVSECIYTRTKQFQQFKKLYSLKRVIIGVIRECVSPDLNVFDYVLAYDRDVKNEDRIFRLNPFYYFWNTDVNICNNKISIEQCKKELMSKKYFCNFIYSNPAPHYLRDEIFYKISSYKKVDSLGKHLTNTRIRPTRDDENWKRISIELKKNYKFSIAAENAKYPGYNSEKIMTSYMAHSIPIYFGDPNISDEYNEKSYILVSDEKSLEIALKRVIEIDRNDELWIDMIREPWMTNEQIERVKSNYYDYMKFLDNIFAVSIKNAVKRPLGSFGDNYADWFFRKYHHKKVTYRNIQAKIRLLIKK
ncbi:MAG: hypothetical protein HFH41_14405 [Lachnospiraceae bacterium]|nr:hypothetical protein [Lachnospiraceae bacterium]